MLRNLSVQTVDNTDRTVQIVGALWGPPFSSLPFSLFSHFLIFSLSSPLTVFHRRFTAGQPRLKRIHAQTFNDHYPVCYLPAPDYCTALEPGGVTVYNRSALIRNCNRRRTVGALPGQMSHIRATPNTFPTSAGPSVRANKALIHVLGPGGVKSFNSIALSHPRLACRNRRPGQNTIVVCVPCYNEQQVTEEIPLLALWAGH